jgi:hypothetical protein
MGLDRLLLIMLVIVALLAGVWIGRLDDENSNLADVDSFRGWLWQRRSLDLAVQTCLIFVGALGTAALLPRDGEEDD